MCVCCASGGRRENSAGVLSIIFSFPFTFAPHSGAPNSVSQALVSGYAHTKASHSAPKQPRHLYFLDGALGRTQVSQEISVGGDGGAIHAESRCFPISILTPFCQFPRLLAENFALNNASKQQNLKIWLRHF